MLRILLQIAIVGVGCLLLQRLFNAYLTDTIAGLSHLIGWVVVYLAIGAPLYFLASRRSEIEAEISAQEDSQIAARIFGIGFFGTIALLLSGHFLSKL